MDRNKLRAALLKSSQSKSQIVDIEGFKVEVRYPTVGVREKLIKQSTKNGELDNYEFIFRAVVSLTFVPGTDESIFELTDKDILYSQSTGGTYDQLISKVSEVLNVEEDLEKK